MKEISRKIPRPFIIIHKGEVIGDVHVCCDQVEVVHNLRVFDLQLVDEFQFINGSVFRVAKFVLVAVVESLQIANLGLIFEGTDESTNEEIALVIDILEENLDREREKTILFKIKLTSPVDRRHYTWYFPKLKNILHLNCF